MDIRLQQYAQKQTKPSVPELRPGYQVKVHQKISEGGKERIQVFEGLVIALNSGSGVSDSFTVRKISEGIGVEKVFPIHSPTVVKVDVVRAHRVRRSKLSYLRNLSGKSLRLKEVEFNLRTKEGPAPEAAAEVPVEEEKKDAAEPEEAPSQEEKAPAKEAAKEKDVAPKKEKDEVGEEQEAEKEPPAKEEDTKKKETEVAEAEKKAPDAEEEKA